MNFDFSIIGTKDTTIAMVKHLIHGANKPDCIITIDETQINTTQIAGFAAIDDLANENKIKLFKVKDYAMKDEDTRRFFLSNSFGLAVCLGWQRLIPQYVLDRFQAGIFGFHGSCAYLPYGRGRSPLNWSIINGDDRFILNLFRYDKDADSPNVFTNRMFQITEHDTIRTLQYKNLLCSFEMVEQLLDSYRNHTICINSQSKDFDSLYGKRTPEDGKLDFTKKTREIYNLIRGVTKPFPGAFAYVDDGGKELVRVWEAAPFDSILDFSKYQVGEIVEIFDGMPIIRTLDGSLIIKRHESARPLRTGQVLS